MSDVPRGRPIDPGLGNLADAQKAARDAEIIPERAPKLRGHAIGTLAELRKTLGDITGNRGPASTMLSGYETAQDGGEGTFVWHPTSVDADNGGKGVNGRVQVANVKVGRWHRTSPPAPPDTTGRLLRLTGLTGTSLAVFPGTKSYRVRIWGGGGGGGGVISAACAAAGGGGAGAPAERAGTSIPSTWNFVLGAAGAAGSTAGGDGGNGGDSTFTSGSGTVTAPGGSGGKGDAAGTAGATSRARKGGAGGAASTGGSVFNGGGAPGLPAHMVRITFGDTMATSGSGGSSSLAGGGLGHERSVTASAAGNDAVGYAAGGGGAIDDGTAARAGGVGGPGYGILEEYA